MTGSPDLELIERCRRGDESAFRQIVDEHKSMVFGLIGRAIPNRARAEELAQDVFLRVYRGLPYFRAEARLSTWIYRIVLNLIAEERGLRTVPTVSLDEPVNPDRGPRLDPGAMDRAFEAIELRDRLDRALAQLPLHYQVLVNGHYIKGMRYEDLAAAMNLPMGTVKTHLHRAKRLLRELLETELT
jgi:RNA polymerase sigma-70 factor (ECF subfamily)